MDAGAEKGKSPDTEVKCYKSLKPLGETRLSELLIRIFVWHESFSVWYRVEDFWQRKPERFLTPGI